MVSKISFLMRSRNFAAAALASAVLACSGISASAQSVGAINRHYVDEHRKNWDMSGARPLETTIWYPAPDSQNPPATATPVNGALFELPTAELNAPFSAEKKRYPLIVLSHGTGGCAAALSWLGHYLAAHGYIVAAVNHHGNTCGDLNPRGFFLWWERARDLSAVIDRLLEDPELGSRIDRTRIGVAGFSLGGYTVTTIAGGRIDRARYKRFCESPQRDFTCGPQPEFPEAPAQFAKLEAGDPVVKQSLEHSGDSYRDPRVKAAFAMAPVFASGFAAKDLADIRIPFEIVVGASDTSAPPATNAERFARLIKGAKLTVLPGGVGHYDFVPVCTPEGLKQLGDRLCRDAPDVDRRAMQTEVEKLALDFFDRALASPTTGNK